MIRYALFDLDDTLYPPAAGLMAALSERFTQCIAEQLEITLEQAEALRREYAKRYGSTTRGLALHHDISIPEFLTQVHDLPIEDYLEPDPDLGCLLDCIHAEKCVFTNAPGAYAERVLAVLGVAERFCRVFALEHSDYRGKPDPATYELVLSALGAEDRELVMLDDVRANLVPAAERGWTTVWVNGRGKPANPQDTDTIDYVVGDLWEVAHVFREIGLLDEAHHEEWNRCLLRCPLGQRKAAGAAGNDPDHGET
jgi:putative hydrolase of the HAD superfamily